MADSTSFSSTLREMELFQPTLHSGIICLRSHQHGVRHSSLRWTLLRTLTLFLACPFLGLRVYEQDWLFNEFYEYVGPMLSSLSLGRTWLLQMGSAAHRAGITVQYCMPFVRHLLQSLELPAVTQVATASCFHFKYSKGMISGLWKLIFFNFLSTGPCLRRLRCDALWRRGQLAHWRTEHSHRRSRSGSFEGTTVHHRHFGWIVPRAYNDMNSLIITHRTDSGRLFPSQATRTVMTNMPRALVCTPQSRRYQLAQ